MCFEILLVLILFQFKKTAQHFRNSGCKSKILQFYNKKNNIYIYFVKTCIILAENVLSFFLVF